MSFSLIAGTLTMTPGRLMPLLLLTGPRSRPVHVTSVAVTSVARSRMRPSSIRISSPALTSPGQALVRRRAAVLVAEDVVGRDRERRRRPRAAPAVGEPAEPDLGALQVGEDRDGLAGLVGGVADPLVVLLVVGLVTVAHVEPGDVHAGLGQLQDLVGAPDRGTEGADDLCSSHDFDPIQLPRLPASHLCGLRQQIESRQTVSGRAVGGIGAGRLVEPERYASTPAAAERPSAMAHTISDCPRPASPATNTPSTLDM